MAGSSTRTRAQEINTWTQTIGIIVAAVWGMYTFGYKEIFVPQTAPVNISLNLQLQKVGESSHKNNKLVAVQMKVSATNPSSREVNVLPSAWFAYGKKVTYADADPDYGRKLYAAINTLNESFVQRHAVSRFDAVVAAGNLFRDNVLKPNETRERTIIFHIPENQYDLLEVNTIIPIAEDPDALHLEWTFNEDYQLPIYELYRVHGDGQRTRVESKAYTALVEQVRLRVTSSNARLSLLR